jgi:hypothetical protein
MPDFTPLAEASILLAAPDSDENMTAPVFPTDRFAGEGSFDNDPLRTRSPAFPTLPVNDVSVPKRLGSSSFSSFAFHEMSK